VEGHDYYCHDGFQSNPPSNVKKSGKEIAYVEWKQVSIRIRGIHMHKCTWDSFVGQNWVILCVSASETRGELG